MLKMLCSFSLLLFKQQVVVILDIIVFLNAIIPCIKLFQQLIYIQNSTLRLFFEHFDNLDANPWLLLNFCALYLHRISDIFLCYFCFLNMLQSRSDGVPDEEPLDRRPRLLSLHSILLAFVLLQFLFVILALLFVFVLLSRQFNFSFLNQIRLCATSMVLETFYVLCWLYVLLISFIFNIFFLFYINLKLSKHLFSFLFMLLIYT